MKTNAANKILLDKQLRNDDKVRSIIDCINKDLTDFHSNLENKLFHIKKILNAVEEEDQISSDEIYNDLCHRYLYISSIEGYIDSSLKSPYLKIRGLSSTHPLREASNDKVRHKQTE